MSRALRIGAACAAVASLLPAAARAQDPVPPDPAVAITAPAAGAVLGAGVPATLAVQPAGPLASVLFAVDGVPVCFLVAHLQCTWTPGAEHVGAHVLQVQATDPQGRTASSAAPVRVERLAPDRVGASVRRKRLSRRAWRLTTRGSIAVPAGLTSAACGGRATVTVVRGGRTLVDRTVDVSRSCTFRSQVSLRVPRHTRRLRVEVAFEGASLLAPRAARAQTVRLT